MAKLSLTLDTRSSRNGTGQIRLRINHRGTSAFVGTGVYVDPQFFIAGNLYDPIRSKAPMAMTLRDKVARLVRAVEEFIAETDKATLNEMSATDIREKALGSGTESQYQYGSGSYSSGDCCAAYGAKNAPADAFIGSCGRMTASTKRNAQSGDFVAFFEEYGERRRTDKTRDSYAYASKVLRLYCAARGLRTLTFDDVNYARLVDYARWLSETKSPSTRHMFESYVRAAYRDGQKRRLVSRDRDPYFDYSIARVPLKDIDCLTAKQMKLLMLCEPKQAGLQLGRDVALMSFYLCGHNLIDLYEMRLPKDGACVFVRHKIEQRYQREVKIRIEPEFQALIDKYQGDGMLLRFKSTYQNYDSFRHKIAHRLRELSGELGFSVSMPRIRRTWATIAAELDCPSDIINKSMGHVDKTVNDRSYVEYKWWKTAEWNRKIIDHVLGA